MAIASLQITDFRNLSSLVLDPCIQGLNIICGDNGSGKSSLLEAIHYLGSGRSFRVANAGCLIRHTAAKLSVFSRVISDLERSIPLGVERECNGAVRLRVEEQAVSSITELAQYLPLRVIHSHSHHLFELGPQFRRKFLDWGLFYQSNDFLPIWRQFERVLKQRNAVLRDRRPKRELAVWTDEFVKLGLALDQLRRDYVAALLPFLNNAVQPLLAISQVEIRYQPGWNEQADLASLLSQKNDEEFRLGCTQYGPHRADFSIVIDQVPVKHFLSRGQQKLLICAMLVAQGMLLANVTNRSLIYLIDDLPSELDLYSRQKLISLLSKQQTQIFITAIEKEAICDSISEMSNVPINVFHVEHGHIIDTMTGMKATQG